MSRHIRQRSSGDNSPNIAIDQLHLYLPSADSDTVFNGIHLPRPIEPLLGRTDELEQLRHARSHGDEPYRVLIHGLAGMGRCSVALDFAWEVAQEYDLVVHVSCLVEDGTPPASAAEIAQRILIRLGQVPVVPMHASQQLEAGMTGRRCLVVLTDLEDLGTVQGLNLPASTDLIVTSQSSLSAWSEVTRIPLGALDPESALELFALHAGPVAGGEIVVRACLGHPGLIKVSAGVLQLAIFPDAESLASAVHPGSADWPEQIGATVNRAMARIAERLPDSSRVLFARLSTLPFPFLARSDVSVLVGGDGHLDALVPLLEWHLLERRAVDGLDVVVLSAFSRSALRGIGRPRTAQSVRDDTRLVARGIVERVSMALDRLRRRSVLEALAAEGADNLSHVGNAEADVVREWHGFLNACQFLVFIDSSNSRATDLPELVETLRAAAFWQERGGQARAMLATVTLIAHANSELDRPFYELTAQYLAGVSLRDLGFPALACACFVTCLDGIESELARARALYEANQEGLEATHERDLHGIALVGDQAIVELARAIEDLTDDEYWTLAASSEVVANVSPTQGEALPQAIAAINLRQLIRRGLSSMTEASGDVAVVEGLLRGVWNGTPDGALDLARIAVSTARRSSREAHDIWGLLRLDALERMTDSFAEVDTSPLAACMSFGATTTAAELATLIAIAMLRDGSAEREQLDVLVAFINTGSFPADFALADDAGDGNAVLSLALSKSALLLRDMGSIRSARRLAEFIRWFAAKEGNQRFTKLARGFEFGIDTKAVNESVASDFASIVMRGPEAFASDLTL